MATQRAVSTFDFIPLKLIKGKFQTAILERYSPIREPFPVRTIQEKHLSILTLITANRNIERKAPSHACIHYTYKLCMQKRSYFYLRILGSNNANWKLWRSSVEIAITTSYFQCRIYDGRSVQQRVLLLRTRAKESTRTLAIIE